MPGGAKDEDYEALAFALTLTLILIAKYLKIPNLISLTPTPLGGVPQRRRHRASGELA